MTRGKYGARAEIRRAEAELTTTTATYQAAVARLTSENAALIEKLANLDELYRKEMRALKARLNEGLSPELTAYQIKVDELREKLDEARRLRRKWEKQRDLDIRMLIATLRADGWMGQEALDWVLSWHTGGEKVAVIRHGSTEHSKSAEQVIAIQRAEGLRSPNPRYEDKEWRARFEKALATGRVV